MESTLTRRAIAIIIAALMTLGCSMALVGCANDEQVIREGLAKELDAFKNPTKANMQTILGEVDDQSLSELETYGVDIYELMEHAFRGFDYTIGDIDVNGSTATADITITNIDVTAAMSKVMEDVQNDADTQARIQELAESGDQAAVMGYIFDLAYDAMDAQEETVTTDTTINMTKTDNEWTVDEESLEDLTSKMYGDLPL